MSRAAFLSSCSDPFLLSFCVKLFKERWYDEVDTLFINVNNNCGCPQEVESELLQKISSDPKVHIIYHPRGIGNGMPITEMTLVSREDLVMLLEDDGFIFNHGIVSKCFQKIESDLCDAVGSPRFSCGIEIGEAAKAKYGLDYSGYGDVGPWFWPNFFFCKRSDLLKTDLNFGSKTFLAGEFCPQLNHTFKEINHADTFGWGAIQMRHNGVRFQSIQQHKADVYEIESKANGVMNWHPTQRPFDWIHGGSLSAGWGGYLNTSLPDVSNDSAKQEIESRVAFWRICSETVEGFEGFKTEYQKGIEHLIQGCDLNRERIAKKISIYRELLRI